MKDSVKDFDKNVPTYTIDESLEKYQNSKRVLELLAEANKWLENTQLPDIYYERQAEIEAKHRYDTASMNEPLSVASEPTPTYGVSKKEEK